MDLTTRQQAFLLRLLDLYRERRSPIHYTEVAEQLGVNKFSAYDMLKVLERKGVVASEYVLDRKEPGPGRSLIKFYPTELAQRWLAQQRLGSPRSEEWQRVKEGLLRRLQQAREVNPIELAGELLNQLSENQPPMVYCAQMITAFLLQLSGLRELTSHMNPLRALAQISVGGNISLGALGGLGLGWLLTHASEAVAKNLLPAISRYQSYLRDLSEGNRSALASFFQEALAVSQQLAWQPVKDGSPPNSK